MSKYAVFFLHEDETLILDKRVAIVEADSFNEVQEYLEGGVCYPIQGGIASPSGLVQHLDIYKLDEGEDVMIQVRKRRVTLISMLIQNLATRYSDIPELIEACSWDEDE